MSFRIAVVGATGLVGRTMIRVLEERNVPHSSLRLFASARSAGTTIHAFGKEVIVEELTEKSFDDVDFALFSAGGASSKVFAPIAAKNGCVVIDNSSAWRMHNDVPLVVPEVNPSALNNHHGIIANPNCSTIQMVVALNPIQQKYGLRRVAVSTYQSVSGAGQKGVDHLMAEIHGNEPEHRISSHPVAFNTVFHTITNSGEGFSEEEIKMIQETRKIMSLSALPVTATCVRVPILGAHGESVNIETEKPFEIEQVRELLATSEGITVMDNPNESVYPTPVFCNDKDEVFVGRIRRDNSVDNGLHLWVVADNLRKGAATNAVQILQMMIDKNLHNFTVIPLSIS
jgi:aspartate-semialdehyde dehydrogenase